MMRMWGLLITFVSLLLFGAGFTILAIGIDQALQWIHETVMDKERRDVVIGGVFLGAIFLITILAVLTTIQQRMALRYWSYSKASSWTTRGFSCACIAWLCLSVSVQPLLYIDITVRSWVFFFGLLLEIGHWACLLRGFVILHRDGGDLSRELG